jgi:flagellar hook-associated protein 3 FlgL
MRVSTSYIFDQNLSAMLNQQTELGKTQLQVSTGKRILNPSDDPAGSVEILNLKREFSVNEQYQANADKAENKLAIEEGVLKSSTDILQRVRELAVQGLSSTNTQSDRTAIAAEMNALNEQLLALANTRDSNGDYLFSGFNSNTQPYETINGDYQGDEGQRNIKVGSGVLVESNDAGNDVFEADRVSTVASKTVSGTGSTSGLVISSNNATAEISSPITFSYNAAIAPSGGYDVSDGATSVAVPYSAVGGEQEVDLSRLSSDFPNMTVTLSGTPVATPGPPVVTDTFTIATTQQTQSVFKTIDQFTQALTANQVGPNNGPNNGDFLTNISASISTVIDTQAKVGARMNVIENQKEINDGISYNMEKTLSEIQDLDYAEAISRLTRQTTSLQAAQQSFVKVQGLSLFNYL